jgi:hypothetical protein
LGGLDTQEFNHLYDNNLNPYIITAQRLNILFHYPREKGGGPMRGSPSEKIDHSIPWDFFDGASQNSIQSCGGGALHFFKFTMGFGNGTNNCVEIMSFKGLLLFSKEKGVTSFQIFWDSMLAVNYKRKSH